MHHAGSTQKINLFITEHGQSVSSDAASRAIFAVSPFRFPIPAATTAMTAFTL
jgi:hypothetical protein